MCKIDVSSQTILKILGDVIVLKNELKDDQELEDYFQHLKTLYIKTYKEELKIFEQKYRYLKNIREDK